jgi:hypothetical protein
MDQEQLRSLIVQHVAGTPFAGWVEELLPICKPCIRFTHSSAPSSSYLGGQPQLAPGTEWPIDADGDPLAFVAAIDLQHVPAEIDEGLHSLGGVLSFFYDTEGQAWGERDQAGNWRVLHVESGTHTSLLDYPSALGEFDRYPRINLSPSLGLSYGPLSEEMLSRFVGNADLDLAFGEVLGEGHQMLGVAVPIQGPVEAEMDYWLGEDHFA